jgi:chromosomal replication initiation ATPase DnaA
MRRPLGPEQIVKEIATSQEVEPPDLLSRKAKLLRQIAMELCYRYSTVSQREIGELFRVDYSTVSQNRARLRAKLETDAKLRRLFEQMEQRILDLSK